MKQTYYRTELGKKEARRGFSMTVMFLIYTAIFFIYPLAWLIVLVFSNWHYVDKLQFAGFSNFISLFQNGIFWYTIWNTVKFMIFFLPMVLIGSMLFALGLTRVKYGKTIVALCFLVANFAPSVGYSLIFKNILSPVGPLNAFLMQHYHVTIPWLDNKILAMFSIAMIVAWKSVGYFGLIFFAGMNSIPQSIYEAGDIDGASKVKQYFKLTLPLMNPQIIMVLIFAISTSFGIFTEPYLITGGGPMQSTLSPMLYMYNMAFIRIDPSHAATMAIVTSLICFGIIWVSRKIMEKDVDIV